MEAESRSNGQDALEDLAADASFATELDIGLASAPKQAKRAWMSSPESASSAVSVDTWPVTVVDLTPGVQAPRTAITVADHPHLPVMVVVVAPLDPMAGILMTMATADVVTPDPLTVAMAPLAATVRDLPTTVDTVDALLRPTTVMAAVVALPAPMGKNYSRVYCFHFVLNSALLLSNACFFSLLSLNKHLCFKSWTCFQCRAFYALCFKAPF